MRLNVGTKIGSGFAAGLVMFAIVSVAAYMVSNRLMSNMTDVQRCDESLGTCDVYLLGVRDAEDAQRGYLLTGREHYLETLKRAEKESESSLGTLRRQMADNPRQLQRVDALKTLLDSKIAALAEQIDLRKKKGLEQSLPEIEAIMDKSHTWILQVAELTDLDGPLISILHLIHA